MEPCAVNLHNLHPRATELLYVIDADNLQAGFAAENGGRTIVNHIKTGYVLNI